MYDLITIKTTIERVLGKDVSLSKLKTELERVTWTPEVNRMVAVADRKENLEASDRYGMFVEMTDTQEFKLTHGTWKFARPLNADELANCF